jgi:hypothetical protein
MHLYVETMDAVLVEFAADGRVRLVNDDHKNDEWITPTVQERRAIIHAAQSELENLKELLDTIEAEL